MTVRLVRLTQRNVVTARGGAAAGVAAQVSQSLYWTPYCSLYTLYAYHTIKDSVADTFDFP